MQEQTITGFRISPQQRRVWRLSQQTPTAYATQGIFLLQGDLDSARLEQSVEQVIARYEILRTTFVRPPGIKVPFQVIAATATPLWQQLDLRDLPAEAQETRIESLWRAEEQRTFDLEKGPLLRLSLLTLAPETHLLLVSLPALCADSWTLHTLMHELSLWYAAGATQGDDEDEQLQYADFSEWQHDLLEAEDEDAAQGRAYWQRQNFAAYPPLKLPTEQLPRQQEQQGQSCFAPDHVSVHLESALIGQLEQLARQRNTSPAAVLLACWQLLLWRLTGTTDLLIGHVYDGRTDEDLRNALGLFARWLPLSCHIEEKLPFGEFLWLTSEALREGAEWQDYFSWDEYLATAPAGAEAAMGFQFIPQPAQQYAAGVTITIDRQQSVFNRFKLHLTCTQAESGLTLTLHYDPALLTTADVQQLADQYATLVQSAVQQPEASVSQLAILSEQARQQLLVTFNATATAYPHTQCLHQLFEAQVAHTPNQPALRFLDEEVTYAELNAQANQLAHYLRRRGVGPNVYVGLCVERSVAMMVGLLGILKAGGAYVPLNPAHPAARLRHQLDEIEAPILLTERAYLDQLPAFAGEILCLDGEATPWRNQADAAASDNPAIVNAAEDPVYVIYTSGSTGTPKGVVIRHRNLVNYAHFICGRLGLQPAGSNPAWHFGLVSTITADLGNTCLFPALVTGGCLHLLPQAVTADGGRFADYVTNHPLDVLKIVPSHLNALLAAQSEGCHILPRKYLILGGEAFSWALLDRILAQEPTCEVLNHYGPTETTVGSLTTSASALAERPRLSATVPIGRPIANTQLYILDEAQQPVPIGVPGELYIGGDGVAQGYLNRPDLTAARFVSVDFGLPDDPKIVNRGCPLGASIVNCQLYRTGDLVRYIPAPDGGAPLVEFLGRVDNQVKIRGFRVELEEIETQLNQHDGVRQAVVVVHDAEAAQKQLVAYLVAQKETAPSHQELRHYLAEHLPDYMLPAAFVTLDNLPLTPNGKVDRRSLSARPLSAESRGSRSSQGYVAPSTPTEETLAEIWAQVLRRPKVGVHDNFFADLGGDSILSIQVIARANSAGLHLTPKQIFEYQTIAELAVVAGAAKTIDAEQGVVTGPAPLTPIQQWFFAQNFVEPHHWNQAVLLEVRQALDATLLEEVVQALVAHHDALRLRFIQTEQGWTQRIIGLEAAGNYFSTVDLSATPAAEQSAAIAAQVDALQATLNFTTGPLARFVLFDLGAERPARLFIVIHHLAVDGVSWRILLEDLQAGYHQRSRHAEIVFPPKSTSFKRWAERLTDYAQSAAVQNELDYWLTTAHKQVRPLPVDFPGGANTIASAQAVTIALTAEETQALLAEVPEVYHTQINDVLLTALAQAVAHWTGNSALLVNLEGHGREEIAEEIDISRTVGWFTTHIPLLLQLPSDSGRNGDARNGAGTDIGDALVAVKEQLRALPQRGIGYGLLRYLSQDPAVVEQMRALPQPQIAFNYLGQFDQVLPEASPFGMAPESSGEAQSPASSRSNLLYIGGSIVGGRLQLACRYSDQLYRRTTVEQLAQAMERALREIISHCRTTEAGRFTPSDFALAGLDNQKLSTVSSLLSELDELDELDELEEEMV